MLRRIVLSVILALALITTVPTQAQAAYADGAAIGAAFMGGFPANTSLGITGQFKGVPLMFGASARILFGSGYTFFGIGFTMDWWGLKIPLLQDSVGIHFYLGPGLGLSADFGSQYWNINAALRVPIGFSFIFAKNWEVFVELAPSVGVLSVGSGGFRLLGIYIGDGGSGFDFGSFFGFAGQLGFRYWF